VFLSQGDGDFATRPVSFRIPSIAVESELKRSRQLTRPSCFFAECRGKEGSFHFHHQPTGASATALTTDMVQSSCQFSTTGAYECIMRSRAVGAHSALQLHVRASFCRFGSVRSTALLLPCTRQKLLLRNLQTLKTCPSHTHFHVMSLAVRNVPSTI
jgi:hypothetical protein